MPSSRCMHDVGGVPRPPGSRRPARCVRRCWPLCAPATATSTWRQCTQTRERLVQRWRSCCAAARWSESSCSSRASCGTATTGPPTCGARRSARCATSGCAAAVRASALMHAQRPRALLDLNATRNPRHRVACAADLPGPVAHTLAGRHRLRGPAAHAQHCRDVGRDGGARGRRPGAQHRRVQLQCRQAGRAAGGARAARAASSAAGARMCASR